MTVLKNLKNLPGKLGVFFIEHPTRKYGIKKDRQWVTRQIIGGVSRISVLGWQSEGYSEGDALNKAEEYKRNHKWNQHNPNQTLKPLCIADEKQILKTRREAVEAQLRREELRPTFKNLWLSYRQTLEKSLAADKSRFEKHLKDFHNKTPEELFPLDIERFKKKLAKDNLSPQTIKHCLTLLTRIVNYGVDQQQCNPLSFKIKKPSFDNQVTEVLSDDQLQALLVAIESDLKKDPFTGRAMLLALSTGMRRGAIMRLKWDDIDFTFGFIVLRDAKSTIANKIHRIPLNDAATKVFQCIPKTDSPHIFPGEQGNDGEWKQRADFNRGTRRIKKAARLPEDFRPFHGLRHHYASTLASSGQVDLYTLQKLLTHADPSTTQRYAHLRDDRLKQGAAVANTLIKLKKDEPEVINLNSNDQ